MPRNPPTVLHGHTRGTGTYTASSPRTLQWPSMLVAASQLSTTTPHATSKQANKSSAKTAAKRQQQTESIATALSRLHFKLKLALIGMSAQTRNRPSAYAARACCMTPLKHNSTPHTNKQANKSNAEATKQTHDNQVNGGSC